MATLLSAPPIAEGELGGVPERPDLAGADEGHRLADRDDPRRRRFAHAVPPLAQASTNAAARSRSASRSPPAERIPEQGSADTDGSRSGTQPLGCAGEVDTAGGDDLDLEETGRGGPSRTRA